MSCSRLQRGRVWHYLCVVLHTGVLSISNAQNSFRLLSVSLFCNFVPCLTPAGTIPQVPAYFCGRGLRRTRTRVIGLHRRVESKIHSPANGASARATARHSQAPGVHLRPSRRMPPASGPGGGPSVRWWHPERFAGSRARARDGAPAARIAESRWHCRARHYAVRRAAPEADGPYDRLLPVRPLGVLRFDHRGPVRQLPERHDRLH